MVFVTEALADSYNAPPSSPSRQPAVGAVTDWQPPAAPAQPWQLTPRPRPPGLLPSDDGVGGGGWSWVILAQRGLCRGAVFAQRRPIDLAGMFSKRHCRMKRFLPNPASVQPFLHGFSTVIVLRLSSPSPATSPSSFFMAMTWFTRICRHILYLFILHPLSLFTEKQI